MIFSRQQPDGMSCQFWRDLKRTGPNLRELVLDNLFRDEASEMRVKCVCLTGSVSLRVTRLKTIRCRWLDVWTLWQSRRISSEALQPETNTSTLLGAEQTRSLQQAGQQYTICWLGNRLNRSGPKKKPNRRPSILQLQGCRSLQLFQFCSNA